MASQVLKSESYGNSLLVHLKDLYDRNQFCDFFLTTSTEEFHVHRLILSGVSNYFKSLLCDGANVCDSFHISAFDADCVQTVIHFMYTGTLVLSQANIWNILALSTQFEISDVTELCQQFVKELMKPGTSPTVSKDSSLTALQHASQVITSTVEKACSSQSEGADSLLRADVMVKLEPLEEFSVEPAELEIKPDFDAGGSTKVFSDDDYSNHGATYPSDDDDPADSSFSYTPSTQEHCNRPTRKSSRVRSKPVSSSPSAASTTKCGPSSVRKQSRRRKDVTQTELDYTLNNTPSSVRKYGRRKKLGQSDGVDSPMESTPPTKKQRLSSRFSTPTAKSKQGRKGTDVAATAIAKRKLSNPKMLKKHLCALCDKKFIHLTSLHLHKKCCHFVEGHRMKSFEHAISWSREIQLAKSRCDTTMPGLFMCTLCKKTLRSKQRLSAHVMKRHPLHRPAHKCTNCKPAKTFHSPKHLYSHRHHKHRHKTLGTAPSRDHLRKCLFCNRVFMYKKSFQQHQAAVHSAVMAVPEMTWECTVEGCEVSGTTQLAYMDHMVQSHPGIETSGRKGSGKRVTAMGLDSPSGHLPDMDRELGVSAIDNSNLNFDSSASEGSLYVSEAEIPLTTSNHIKPISSVATNARTCNWCTFATTSAMSLVRHRRVKHGGLLSCTHCPRKFSCKFDLMNHTRQHEGQEYICDQCCKSFTTRQGLWGHRRQVHEGATKYACGVCQKRFLGKGEYTGHMNMHMNQRPYECSKCKKSFTRKQNKTSHENLCGVLDKSHQCPVCGTVFKRENTLKQHVKFKHGAGEESRCVCGKSFVWPASLRRHAKTCEAVL